MKSFGCFEGDPNPNPEDEKKFTQGDINTFLAKEKRKTQEAQKKLAEQLEEAKKSVTLGEEAKNELQVQIDELQTQYLTTEERARQEAEKAKDQHSSEMENLTTARDTWQSRYTEATIDVEITGAAIANKAISTEQIAALLRPNTKLAEKIDEDGKPNGIFEAKVSFKDTDKDGKPIILDLTVPEAVKRMTELEAYDNLFISGKSGGLGGSGNKNSKKGDIDIAKIAKTNPALYRKLRKERPELFGQ